ncbi:MAG: lycopene cyclase family protein [Archaeoglobaceae archaeon]
MVVKFSGSMFDEVRIDLKNFLESWDSNKILYLHHTPGDVEVLIVGGGPAGCLSAIEIGSRSEDHNITILEEHPLPGFPVQCAGLISRDCYQKLRNYVSDKCHVNDIKGAFLFSPDGNHIKMEGRSKAVVIERKVLDSELLREASIYATVKPKTRFEGANLSASSGKAEAVSLSPQGTHKIPYDVLIGADGCTSSVARTFGFERPNFFSALQFECEFEPIDPQFVELFFGREYTDSFFGYAIPIDESTARLGVVARENPSSHFRNLLERHPSVSRRVNLKKITELNAGAIPTNLINFVKDNVALIGDSGGMVKPYTGGGLYYHLIAAETLGRTFPNLQEFRNEYLKKMEIEYRVGSKILKLYSSLSDKDYNNLVRVGKEGNVEELVKNLHMDSPSSLVKIIPSVLKIFSRSPRLFTKIGRIMV